MPISMNPQTGETVFLDATGQWKPAQTAKNPESGETVAFDGTEWQAIPEPETVRFDPFVAAKGIGEGLKRATQGIQQFFKEGEELEKFNERIIKERAEFEASNVGQSAAGQVSKFIGETAPTLLVPGGLAGGIARRSATSALAGGGIGATQFTEDRAKATGTGAAIGGATPGVIQTIASSVKGGKALLGTLAPFLGVKTTELVKKAGGDELLNATLKKVEAGKRIGLDLTPAEASGSKELATLQGRAGRSKAGGKVIQEFAKKREKQSQSSIRQFLFGVSPEGSSANEAIRRASKKAVGDEIFALQTAAKPFYEKARRDLIPEENLKQLVNDPVIKKAYDDIFKDVTTIKESKDVALNSIQMLDLAKKNIDQSINREVTSRAPNAFRIKVLGESKQDLVNVADTFSPDYATARGIYEVGSPAVERLQSSVVGRIANMSDDRIKNVSKTLFDTSQTDVKVLRKMARRFSSEDPDAWRQVIRNEMERRMDQIGADRTPSSFFDQILKKDRDFKLFFTATEGMPATRKALVDMRRAFKDLIPPTASVKATAFRAGEGLSEGRSNIQAAFRIITEMGLNLRDKSIAEIITNPRWHQQLGNILKNQKKGDRIPKLAALISKVGAGLGARQTAPPGTISLEADPNQ